MALPQLTDDQRKAALEKAAAARHARAELREKIKKGEVSLESVLNSEDPIASRMKVSSLIEALLVMARLRPPRLWTSLAFLLLAAFRVSAFVSASSCLSSSPSK